MEERKISTLVSLLGEDVLTEDCLVVVTGGNNDKEQNQNFEKNNPQCNNFSSNMLFLNTTALNSVSTQQKPC